MKLVIFEVNHLLFLIYRIINIFIITSIIAVITVKMKLIIIIIYHAIIVINTKNCWSQATLFAPRLQ